MYINNEDLEFLRGLLSRIDTEDEMTPDAEKLRELIARLTEQRSVNRAKTWASIKEKRKTNKNYGRSKK